MEYCSTSHLKSHTKFQSNSNWFLFTGICSNNNVPSVSSINRILRNRAAERAAVEYTKIASRSLFQYYPQFWPLPPVQDVPRDYSVTSAPRELYSTDRTIRASDNEEEAVISGISSLFHVRKNSSRKVNISVRVVFVNEELPCASMKKDKDGYYFSEIS